MSVLKSTRVSAGALALFCALSLSGQGGSVWAKPGETAGAKTAAAKSESAKDEFAGIKIESDEQDQPVLRVTAREHAEQAQQLANARALDHYDMSRFYFSQWDLEMAEVELEAAIMHMPSMKVAHRDYCVVSMLRGHPMRSMAEFMMVVGLGEPIPFTESERIELKKKAARLHYRKALSYGKKDRWDNAISEMKWALEFQPESATIQRSLAFAYASKGDFDLAEKQYSESIADDGSDPGTHADFAYLLADKGQGPRAFSQMAEAVKLAPGAAAFHVDLAWMAETKGDFKTAQSELQEAIRLSPKHAGLWTHLGRVLEREGDKAEARYAYQHALWIDSEQAEARRRIEQLPPQKETDGGARKIGTPARETEGGKGSTQAKKT